MATTTGWRNALAPLAPKTTKPRAAKPASSKTSAVDAQGLVLAAVRAAAELAPEGDLLSVAKVRARCPGLDKAAFDGAALALQTAGKIVLHHNDAWFWCSEDVQEAMVASGEFRFSGVALRRSR